MSTTTRPPYLMVSSMTLDELFLVATSGEADGTTSSGSSSSPMSPFTADLETLKHHNVMIYREAQYNQEHSSSDTSNDVDASAEAAPAAPAPAHIDCTSSSTTSTTTAHQEELPILSEWDRNFQALVRFKQRYGHCDVKDEGDQQQAASQEEHASLVQWVQQQRHEYKLRLEGKIGIVESVARTADSSSSSIPNTPAPPTSASSTTAAPAAVTSDFQLTAERETKLTNLGFIWKFDQACWYAYYCQLTEFHKQHGHCNVPSNYKPNKNLHVWCKLQRKQYKRMIIAKKKQRAMINKMKRSILKNRRKQGHQHDQDEAAETTTRLLLAAATARCATPTTNYFALLRMSKLNELGFCWNPRNIR